jgi:microcystin-dependent protein
MAEPIGNIYKTAVPSLNDTANIQEALRIYHYGRPSGSDPNTQYNINNEELSDLVEDSIAFYLNNLQEQITDVNSAFDPLAYSKKGNLLSAGFDGPVTLELSPNFPTIIAPNGLVLTSDDSTETGLAWRAPQVTLSTIQSMANKTFSSSFVSGGGALVGTTTTQTLTNKTLTSPTISGATLSTSSVDGGGSVVGTTATQTLTNKELTSAAVTGGGNVVGTTATQTLTNKTISLEAADNTITGRLASTNGGIPAGVISQFAGSSAPAGYLLCQGQSVSTAEFAGLFAAIGYNYGGSGASFNVPNLENRVPVGKGSGTFGNLNNVGGAESVTLTVDQMPSHSHTQNAHSHGASSGSAGSHSHTASTNTAGSHTHGDSGSHTHGAFRGINASRGAGTSSGIQSTNISSAIFDTTTATTHTHTSSGGHSHTITVADDGSHSHAVSVDNATATNQNTGGGLAHNNLQPYIVVNYIIKT